MTSRRPSELEKATSLCSRDGSRAVLCANLTFELYYRLGHHEGAREWPEAMTEYQRVLGLAGQVRGRGDLKAATQEAVSRLSPKLGQVVVPKRGKRSCAEDTIWLRPGVHSIRSSTASSSRSRSKRARSCALASAPAPPAPGWPACRFRAC